MVARALPADADALVTCGRPGDRLAAAVEAVWQQLPGPRAREDVADADVVGALDRVEASLLDQDGQRADARGRQHEPTPPQDARADDGDTGDMDMGLDPGDMDMTMDMAPNGISLAGGFDHDRDGLEMDVLHVTLGPLLPAWPAGVVLRATLSGDVLVDARIEVLDTDDLPAARAARAAPAGAGEPAATAARGCDRAATLLGLAGAEDLAAGLRRVRDDLLAGAGPERMHPRLARLTRTVRRSGVLRWSLRGLGRLDAASLKRHALPASCGGDVHDRLVATLQGAVDVLRPSGAPDRHGAHARGRGRGDHDDAGVTARLSEVVPDLVTG